MIADVLTKPLQGYKFKKFRQALLNWEDCEEDIQVFIVTELCGAEICGVAIVAD
jgi:hypothetical protein